MARTAERTSRAEGLSPGNAEGSKVIDAALKDLIDNLIVPKLVEDFLRQHGPASVAEGNQLSPESSHPQLDSELD